VAAQGPVTCRPHPSPRYRGRVRAPPFTSLAQVYDEIMQDVPYDGWVEFALRGASARGWVGGRAVDLGCGTGNVTAALERRGIAVVGVDASAAMLDVARGKVAAPLIHGDIRDAALPGRFALALAVFDTVNNLLEDDDLATLAAHVRRHLEEGGGWVFDVNTTAGLESLWDDDLAEGWAGEVHYRWVHRWDAAARLATVEAWCESPAGAFVELHQERPYDPPDLLRILTGAGFGQVDVVTYPGGRAAADDDPRVWVFAGAAPALDDATP
jgi:SAM-dependent methyltransferase